MTCRQCIGIEAQFNDRVAERELRKYRRNGPRRTTKMLLGFVRSRRPHLRSLLDVGGGIGAIQHELADSIAGPIASVEAAPAYLATAEAEGTRRGYAERASYISGDFVDEAERVPSAELVTMDRVICCYPHVEALLTTAAQKARSAVGLVFPREETYVRVGMRLANWVLRLMRSDFQGFIHPHRAVEKTMAREGFRLTRDAQTVVWRVALFERPAGSKDSEAALVSR